MSTKKRKGKPNQKIEVNTHGVRGVVAPQIQVPRSGACFEKAAQPSLCNDKLNSHSSSRIKRSVWK